MTLGNLDSAHSVLQLESIGSPRAWLLLYPSPQNAGVTALCNADGRVTILMPHPERTIAGTTGSWWPQRFASHTPWLRMFENARRWVG